MARRRGRGELSSGAWAVEVTGLYGRMCLCCGDHDIELDHIVPKSQGGLYLPGNGAPLCSFRSRMSSFANGCHAAKTAGQLQYRRAWLHPTTLAYLAEVGWVDWDQDGQSFGRGWRHFAPISEQKGG